MVIPAPGLIPWTS